MKWAVSADSALVVHDNGLFVFAFDLYSFVLFLFVCWQFLELRQKKDMHNLICVLLFFAR